MKDNNRLLSLQNKYNEILLEDGGLRTLCGVLTEDINNFVFILDKYRENLLYIDRKLRQDMDFYDYLDYKKLEKKK
ncbi:hypothetical protein [Orenia marismortui]|uniref:hypothetical protein n=1 Tax=Orenia marismortui TaxID=46469 RepID=UPI0003794662|nr:hypothetical protein [Orenia marismortui]